MWGPPARHSNAETVHTVWTGPLGASSKQSHDRSESPTLHKACGSQVWWNTKQGLPHHSKSLQARSQTGCYDIVLVYDDLSHWCIMKGLPHHIWSLQAASRTGRAAPAAGSRGTASSHPETPPAGPTGHHPISHTAELGLCQQRRSAGTAIRLSMRRRPATGRSPFWMATADCSKHKIREAQLAAGLSSMATADTSCTHISTSVGQKDM